MATRAFGANFARQWRSRQKSAAFSAYDTVFVADLFAA
ncbi:MAG: hypothetical protein QOD01_2084, partial [Actinomycetota bacterium]|nr:hypothetical protein [Actinomycetota bacterium]